MTQRSRIEGTLHRWLPAQISIITRAMAEGDDEAAEGTAAEADDQPLQLRISVSSEEPYLRQSWWDEPWIEVLGHKAGEVDLLRLNGGAPVLANHCRDEAVGNTPLAGIGAITKAWLDGSRLMCDITLSRREALEDLRQDIADGLVRNVSIGYLINERVLTKATAEGQPDEYRVTSWTPFEVSLVDIPADATVGLGRTADAVPGYRVIDIPVFSPTPAEGTTLGNRSMTTATATPSAANPGTETRAAAQHVSVQDNGATFIAQERERTREIGAIGKQLGMAELAERAIEAGTSLEAFRAQVIKTQVDSGAIRQAESAEIGMSQRDIGQFSFMRALLAAADPANAAKIAPFELECSRAAQDRRGNSRDNKLREAAVTIPVDVLRAGISLNSQEAASAQRQLNSQAFARNLVAGTPTAGGNTVATELWGSSFIELLRNALVLDRMGVTMLRDLNGNIAIPSQTGAATGYWVTEDNAPTESQQTLGQVPLTPKTVGAYTDYSRRLLLQSSIDVEAFVRADLAAIIAQALLAAAINGPGTGGAPTGILNTAGIGSVAMGTNGAVPTYGMYVDLETAVAAANADVGNLAYLTNAKVRGKSRKTEEFATTNGRPVWTNGSERGIGSVLGYDAYVTNAVPSDLTKGSASGICSAAIFGNWSDLIIGMWGGLDVMLDPYTGSISGTKRVVALQDVDMAVRRLASFAAVKDILTT